MPSKLFKQSAVSS